MIRKCLLSGLHSTLVLSSCLGGIAISLPAGQPLSSLSPDASWVKQVARAITVKVLSKGFLGTGILINKQGRIYTVITNDHVLNAADPPYQIQTPDGHIYAAKVLPGVKFGDNDLGLLQFTSDQVYQIASVEKSAALRVGDEVFVSGFTSETREMIFPQGNISLILDKPLEGGYQIGYTNDIRRGMSGGPVLNSQGKLVGINGLHKDPLWEAPDLYADGSQPSKPLQDIIIHSSWAIPIDSVVKLVPKFVYIKPPPTPAKSSKLPELNHHSNPNADSKSAVGDDTLLFFLPFLGQFPLFWYIDDHYTQSNFRQDFLKQFHHLWFRLLLPTC